MKANEAPEKLYVYIPDDDIVGTASTQKGFPHQFVTEEYTRTDAFIDKACDWLKKHSRNDFTTYNSFGQPTFHKSRMIKAFITAMEEEV